MNCRNNQIKGARNTNQTASNQSIQKIQHKNKRTWVLQKLNSNSDTSSFSARYPSDYRATYL